ncbi:LysR substrate-binding domain-containing protein [Thalassospira lucentensis]|uniref:LysR substrate-binding domain-containing protein n=1 Tax=Thalassospira lucentensis TaxID=168935 RepID=UPI003D2A5C32|tara:strand:+ start:1017 stop:2009 length:993 start_codon:yes stop_codon:yes gene_type:complete
MDIRQLRYFVKIVETGSLSKASKQLFVAQPALSQQISKLEEYVGRPLLIRSSKGVKPNQNGQALYHHARLVLRQFDQAISIAKAENETVQGMVSIGLPATTVAALGLDLIKRLRERYPGILINVVEAMSGHIDQLIHQNQLDLAVLFNDEHDDELVIEPLMVEELFLFLSEDSKLLPPDQTTVTVAEVAALPLIVPTSSHGLRRRIETEFSKYGLGMNVVAEIDSLALLMNCVHQDIAATIKPRGAIMQEADGGRKWRCLAFSDAHLRRSNFLYSLPPESMTPATNIVAAELKGAVQDLIDNPAIKGFEQFPTQGNPTSINNGKTKLTAI